MLGRALKADSDDCPDSLSYKLKKLLEVEAREVVCTQPYVADPAHVPLQEALERADSIILGVPHSVYRDLELPSGKTVVDVWSYWLKRANTRLGKAKAA